MNALITLGALFAPVLVMLLSLRFPRVVGLAAVAFFAYAAYVNARHEALVDAALFTIFGVLIATLLPLSGTSPGKRGTQS